MMSATGKFVFDETVYRAKEQWCRHIKTLFSLGAPVFAIRTARVERGDINKYSVTQVQWQPDKCSSEHDEQPESRARLCKSAGKIVVNEEPNLGLST